MATDLLEVEEEFPGSLTASWKRVISVMAKSKTEDEEEKKIEAAQQREEKQTAGIKRQ